MEKIKYFDTIMEAELAKNILEQHGIQSFVEKRGLQFPGDLGDSYGANLFVSEKDLSKAKEVLEIQ